MRLKRVRVFGFKTFADRTEVNLGGGVVAVVGPNGCGKSNLVDAILWGLGEGNSRQLRANSSQDVIFNGSPKRRPLGYSEVQLLFDNEDGSLPVQTSEVLISRRLTRSGESEYAINKRHCRLRDVYELLADSGLGRSGYSIVGQKEVDAALAASAEDRRAWVDEAAGVQRYRVRKTESIKRLESAKEHLSRVDDILRELTAQREPLREEAEVARRYKNLQESLQEVELGLLVNEVAAAVRESKELEARIAESLRLSHEELEKAVSLEAKAKELGVAISDLEADMDALRVLQQGSVTAQERAEAELRLANQKLSSLDETEQNLQDDEKALRDRICEATAELEGLVEEERTEGETLEALRLSFAGVGEKARSLNDALRTIEEELSLAREKNARQLKLEAEVAQRLERRKLALREIRGIEEALPELESAIDDAQGEYEKRSTAVQEEQTKLRQYEERILALRQEEDTDAQKVRKALAEKASLEGRKRGIEATIDANEGLTQGSRAVMEAAERGLLQAEYIPVGRAVTTSKECALAIETALGASANDLIVGDERDAKAAIEWLKQNRAGRATFQPIPLMRPFEPSIELRRLQNERCVVGRASELVECESHHRPVVDSLLGRVLVVESIDDALRLAKTQGWSRLVTIGGEVVHTSGAVTGGQQSRQPYGLVQRQADLAETEKEIAKLARTISQFEGRTAKRQAEHVRIEGEMNALRSGLRNLQTEETEARQFLLSLQDEQKSALRSREKLQTEIRAIESAPDEEIETVDIAGIERRRDEAMKLLAGRSADADQAEQRLREAETRLEQAKLRLEAGRRRLKAIEEADRHRTSRLEDLEPERQRLRIQIERHAKERREADSRRSTADHRLVEAQTKRRGLLEDSLRLSEEAKHARDSASAVGDAAHQAELTRARVEVKRANALARLFEDYGLTEEDAFEQEGTHEVPSDASTVVNRLRREIRAMGDVNIGAIEAFARVNERVEELSVQRDDIVEGMAQVEASIDELDRLTHDRFVKTFEAVQTAFTQQFAKLFEGGDGKLVLTDPGRVLDSGIDFELTLPGKRRQPLSLLSGGERSLCASAFLFALLSVKPSPLVVLDEVDAPLDGRNVERFAETLHQFTDTTQFIVITHNESTIRTANIHLGVTMQKEDPGVSILVPIRLPDDES